LLPPFKLQPIRAPWNTLSKMVIYRRRAIIRDRPERWYPPVFTFRLDFFVVDGLPTIRQLKLVTSLSSNCVANLESMTFRRFFLAGDFSSFCLMYVVKFWFRHKTFKTDLVHTLSNSRLETFNRRSMSFLGLAFVKYFYMYD
jgi:hypothetical protein